MKRLLLKLAKSLLIEIILSTKFLQEINSKVDLPGMDEAQEEKLIRAIADAIKTLV